MSALATRLLVLGVVRIFEPANAYQLRRELLSWNVEQWANLNPGSVYGMLSSLERTGLVRRHVLTGVNGRPVGVYTTTPEGAAEFPALVQRALREAPDWADVTDLRAGLSFVIFLRRDEVLDAIDARLDHLTAVIEAMDRAVAAPVSTPPPHVVEEFGLEQWIARAQQEWLRTYRERVGAGALSFAGEPGDGWEADPDDPGRAMIRDRDHYLAQLSSDLDSLSSTLNTQS